MLAVCFPLPLGFSFLSLCGKASAIAFLKALPDTVILLLLCIPKQQPPPLPALPWGSSCLPTTSSFISSAAFTVLCDCSHGATAERHSYKVKSEGITIIAQLHPSHLTEGTKLLAGSLELDLVTFSWRKELPRYQERIAEQILDQISSLFSLESYFLRC